MSDSKKSQRYILNGVESFRYAYDAIQWSENHNLRECNPPVCSQITRPYYCLVDNGAVYVTDPAGLIYYLGPNKSEMKMIYPLNAVLPFSDQTPDPGKLNPGVSDHTDTTITITWEPGNIKHEDYEQIVRVSKSHLYPWRPGVSGCAYSFANSGGGRLIPYYDFDGNPKDIDNDQHIELPYGNGYYVVQDGESHCLVFYEDTLIYDGRYNSKGTPVHFAYGVQYCPHTSAMSQCCIAHSVNWDLQPHWNQDALAETMNPSSPWAKWKITGSDSSKTFTGFSWWDQAIEEMSYEGTDQNIVKAGNIVHTLAQAGDDLSHRSSSPLVIRPFIIDDASLRVLTDDDDRPHNYYEVTKGADKDNVNGNLAEANINRADLCAKVQKTLAGFSQDEVKGIVSLAIEHPDNIAKYADEFWMDSSAWSDEDKPAKFGALYKAAKAKCMALEELNKIYDKSKTMTVSGKSLATVRISESIVSKGEDDDTVTKTIGEVIASMIEDYVSSTPATLSLCLEAWSKLLSEFTEKATSSWGKEQAITYAALFNQATSIVEVFSDLSKKYDELLAEILSDITAIFNLDIKIPILQAKAELGLPSIGDTSYGYVEVDSDGKIIGYKKHSETSGTEADQQAAKAKNEVLRSLVKTYIDDENETVDQGWWIEDRVIWSETNNAPWATPQPAEQRGEIVRDCDHDFAYTCTETQTITLPLMGDQPCAIPHKKTWYIGTDCYANDNNITSDCNTPSQSTASRCSYKISKWRENCCFLVTIDHNEDPDAKAFAEILAELGMVGSCDEYQCLPEECQGQVRKPFGKNYPVGATGSTLEPIWKHTDLYSVENSRRDDSDPCKKPEDVVDENGNVEISYEIIPSYKADKQVAEVIQEPLGGRIRPVWGSTNHFTNKREPTSWGYIIRDASTCYDRKDYTIIGKIDKFEDLPGVVNCRYSELPEDASEEEKAAFVPKLLDWSINHAAANALVMRAPHNKEGDTQSGFTSGFHHATTDYSNGGRAYYKPPYAKDGKSDGENYQDGSEVRERFTWFCPAYLTRPGYLASLNNGELKSQRSDTMGPTGTAMTEETVSTGHDNLYYCDLTETTQKWDIARGQLPPEPDPADVDQDGFAWEFIDFESEQESYPSPTDPQETETKTVWYVKWKRRISRDDAAAKLLRAWLCQPENEDCTEAELATRYAEIQDGLTTDTDGFMDDWEWVSDAEESTEDEESGSSQQTPVIIKARVPDPPQDDDISLLSKSQAYGSENRKTFKSFVIGHWYPMGPCSNMEKARACDVNQMTGEPVTEMTNYDKKPSSGIVWKQYFQSWGDPDGLAVRIGLRAGDIFYTVNEQIEEQDEGSSDDPYDAATFEDKDKYWFWTGHQWQEGSTLFSNLGKSGYDVAVFYKDEGGYDTDKTENDEYGSCAAAKTIFSGRVPTLGAIQACGELLRINFNQDHTYHKSLFMNGERIWDRPATEGADFTAEDGSPMIEQIACYGDTYVAATYNVGPNRQRFHLWMMDFADADGDDRTNERTVLGHFTAVFAYEYVPDLNNMRVSWVTRTAIARYGKDVQQNYICFLSREEVDTKSGFTFPSEDENGKSTQRLYCFYKARLIATYKDGSRVDVISHQYGLTRGPRYLTVARPGRATQCDKTSEKYDIYIDGARAYDGIIGMIVYLDNATSYKFPIAVRTVLGCWNTCNTLPNGRHRAETGFWIYNLTILETGEVFRQLEISCTTNSYYYTDCLALSSLAYDDAPNGVRLRGMGFGDCDLPDKYIAKPPTSNQTFTATWHGYMYDCYTQKLISRYTIPSVEWCHGNGECETPYRYPLLNGACDPVLGYINDPVIISVPTFKPSPQTSQTTWSHQHNCSFGGVTTHSWKRPQTADPGFEIASIMGTTKSFDLWGPTDYPTATYYVFAVWPNGTVRVYDFFSCSPNTCSSFDPETTRLHYQRWVVMIENFTEDSHLIANDPNHALVIKSDGSYYYTQAPCSASTQYVSCGRYMAWRYSETNANEDDATWNITYEATTIATGLGGNNTNWTDFLKCCSSSYEYTVDRERTAEVAEDGGYAIIKLPTGTALYRKTKKIDDLDSFDAWSFQACCSDAALLVKKDGAIIEARLYIQGKLKQTLTGPQESLETCTLQCCGKDYYLFQYGDYKYQASFEELLDFSEETKISTYSYTFNKKTVHFTYNDSLYGNQIIIHKLKRNSGTDITAILDLGNGATMEAKLVATTMLTASVMSGARIDRHLYERPATWEITLKDQNEKEVTVNFPHDIKYQVRTTQTIWTPSDSEAQYIVTVKDDIYEQRVGYVPWHYQKDCSTRGAFVYYKDTLVSDDPRVTDITCFRYYNEGDELVPNYHAQAAFATFYDDPWTTQRKEQSFSDEEYIMDDLDKPVHPKTKNTFLYEQRYVQNPLPFFDPIFAPQDVIWKDDGTGKQCDCELIAKIKNAHPNVCIKVWEKNKCTSTMTYHNPKISHSRDNPFVPFCDDFLPKVPGETNDQYKKRLKKIKNGVLYINDYNAAARWDRLNVDETTNARNAIEPPDEWPDTYVEDCAGTGGLWVSAPSYNLDLSADNAPFDSTGRLIVSGNNVIYVWDKTFGRMDFNAVTGEKLDYSVYK